MVLPQITRDGAIEAWIIDDTGIPKKGRPLGWGVTPVLRAAWQAGELSGGGDTVACQSPCEACRWRIGCICLTAGPTTMTAAPRRGVPEEITFKNQAADCARTDPLGVRGRPSWQHGADGRRLRPRFQAARGHHLPWKALCGRHSAADAGVEAGHACRVGHRRKVTVTRPIRSWSQDPSPSDCGRELGAQSNGGKAPMNGCPHGLRVCVFTLHRAMTARQTDQRVAADRVARGREGANQVLALDLAEQHHIPRSGRRRQAALAHRARLSGTQAGGRGSGIMKDAGGVASIITPRCASQPTDSWSPKGRRFPPSDLVPPRSSRNLPYPTVTDPEDPPLRPERHVPNSIATVRRRIIDALVRRLPRCPCCRASTARPARMNL